MKMWKIKKVLLLLCLLVMFVIYCELAFPKHPLLGICGLTVIYTIAYCFH